MFQASIHLRDCKTLLHHQVFPKSNAGETFATLDIGDGNGSKIQVYTSNPNDLWELAKFAGAAAGLLARQLRADEAAEKALLETTDPEPPVVIYHPDLGGEAG